MIGKAYKIVNDLQYEELCGIVSRIPDFKKLVSSESKRPTAVRLVSYISGISLHDAWDFVNEYYDSFDILSKTTRIDNKFKKIK